MSVISVRADMRVWRSLAPSKQKPELMLRRSCWRNGGGLRLTARRLWMLANARKRKRGRCVYEGS
eukprot:8830129-Karenia_brevis.AAC.1